MKINILVTLKIILTLFFKNVKCPIPDLNSKRHPKVSPILALPPYSLACGGPPGADGNIFLLPVQIHPQNFPVSKGLYLISIPFCDTPIIISSRSTNLSILISQ